MGQPASPCRYVIAKSEKGKPEKRPTLKQLLAVIETAVTISSSGGYFFSLEHCIAQSHQGANEYPNLN